MKFGPKFSKLFALYPEIDTSKITNKRIHLLTRKELYEIIRGIRAHGDNVPFDQPTRTKTVKMQAFVYNKIPKN